MSVVSEIDGGIGARIRARREGLGVSQAVLAAHLGVTFQQVQKYERGANRVSAATLLKVAGALLCTAAELLGEKTVFTADDDDLGDLYRAWVGLKSEQQVAVVALMKTMS